MSAWSRSFGGSLRASTARFPAASRRRSCTRSTTRGARTGREAAAPSDDRLNADVSLLPTSPSRRRLLVAVTEADVQRWRMNRDSRALLDDDQVAVVVWPYEEGSGDAVLDRLVA